MTNENKTCPKCKMEKTPSEFYVKDDDKFIFEGWCKKCNGIAYNTTMDGLNIAGWVYIRDNFGVTGDVMSALRPEEQIKSTISLLANRIDQQINENIITSWAGSN